MPITADPPFVLLSALEVYSE